MVFEAPAKISVSRTYLIDTNLCWFKTQSQIKSIKHGVPPRLCAGSPAVLDIQQ